MPLYEYHCPPCDIVFEELCSLGEAQTKKPCPDCGRKAPRIVSSFAISHSVSGEPYDPVTASRQNSRDPRPLCMQHSQIPLSCHMDEYSVKRFAAHTAGKGNEFDDSVARAKGSPQTAWASNSRPMHRRHMGTITTTGIRTVMTPTSGSTGTRRQKGSRTTIPIPIATGRGSKRRSSRRMRTKVMVTGLKGRPHGRPFCFVVYSGKGIEGRDVWQTLAW